MEAFSVSRNGKSATCSPGADFYTYSDRAYWTENGRQKLQALGLWTGPASLTNAPPSIRDVAAMAGIATPLPHGGAPAAKPQPATPDASALWDQAVAETNAAMKSPTGKAASTPAVSNAASLWDEAVAETNAAMKNDPPARGRSPQGGR